MTQHGWFCLQVLTVIINLLIWDKHAGIEGIAFLSIWSVNMHCIAFLLFCHLQHLARFILTLPTQIAAIPVNLFKMQLQCGGRNVLSTSTKAAGCIGKPCFHHQQRETLFSLSLSQGLGIRERCSQIGSMSLFNSLKITTFGTF
jgi:hypothetical protein